jgi:uncharacterized protein
MSKAAERKWVLITGATSGFGYEFAKLFAKDGYNLILVARNALRLQEIADELSKSHMIDVLAIEKDLFKPEAADEIYAEVKAKGFVVSILINDAGQGEHGNFVEYETARDVDIIQLNITSLVCLTKHFLKDMVARNEGKILQVASLLSKYPTPMMAVYAASKAFVLSFTNSLIVELKDTDVTVTALLPGAADTDFFHKAGGEDTVTYKEQKLLRPEEVANDGYKALMEGKEMIVSGFKNKLYAAMSTILPDTALAANMGRQMKRTEKPDGRSEITHGPSHEEREQIRSATGSTTGDYQEHEDHIHNKE